MADGYSDGYSGCAVMVAEYGGDGSCGLAEGGMYSRAAASVM